MKYILLGLSIISLIFVTSCKKEIDNEIPPAEAIHVKITKDTTLNFYQNQYFILDAGTGNPASTYNWENPVNSSSPVLTIYNPAELSTIVVNITTDTVNVYYIISFNYLSTTMYYPNSFSPNCVGIDDFWAPVGRDINSNGFSLNIYDPNENLIFETNNWYADRTEGWNGAINIQPCPVGYYYYVCKYQDLRGYRHKDSGMLMLIR